MLRGLVDRPLFKGSDPSALPAQHFHTHSSSWHVLVDQLSALTHTHRELL